MVLTLRQQCARMFVVGFPGQAPDTDLLSLMDAGISGAVLFKRNIASPDQVAGLCQELKSRAGRPFLMAVDQEGGRVARLRGPPFTELPPMRALARGADPALAERVGRLLAREVRAVGFDWDFAPVLDVDTNPENPVIGDRSLDRDPRRVAELGVALARGLESEGVASCAKHFPGHGDTTQDSHHTLPRLPHDLERLRRVELVPFAAYARAGLAAVMTAHVLFEAVDPQVPATMSEKVLTGLLRKELGFQGLLVSDDLEMKAVADHYGVEEAAVAGTLAGVDLFLVCSKADLQRRALEAVIRAVESGRISRQRIADANRRIEAFTARFVQPAPAGLAGLATAEHRSLAAGLVAGPAGYDPTERPA